jgi:hypothetical protein
VPDPVRAVLHSPSGTERARAAVVLCPPFGWEEIWVYRSYMHWADALAGAGYPALRFDLPGTTESGGSTLDPRRFDSWLEAAAAGSGYLRASTGCERVVALGVGVGGMVAYAALAGGAAIDDLVLWSVPARGRAILREARAWGRIVDSASLGTETPPAPAQADGSLNLGGFLLGAGTVAALESLDLTTLEIPQAEARRVLLLSRDTVQVDRRLREHLERSGAAVTVASGPGYASMLAFPWLAEPPLEVFDTTIGWLSGAQGNDPRTRAHFAASPAIGAEDHAELSVGEATIRETPFEFDFGGELLRGTLAEPLHYDVAEAPLCAVLVNPGSTRRIGLARLWVDASRRWAARGVPSLRLDVLGIGESDGDDEPYRTALNGYYRPELTAQVISAIDALERHGLRGRAITVGHCSGGYWAFQASLRDRRVAATVLVNPGALYWRTRLRHYRAEVSLSGYARHTRRLLLRGRFREIARLALARNRIPRVGLASFRRMQRLLATAIGPRFGNKVDRAFARLNRRGVRSYLVLGMREDVDYDVMATGRADSAYPWPGVHLERYPADDHLLVSLEHQRIAHAALDVAVDEMLAAERARKPAKTQPG